LTRAKVSEVCLEPEVVGPATLNSFADELIVFVLGMKLFAVRLDPFVSGQCEDFLDGASYRIDGKRPDKEQVKCLTRRTLKAEKIGKEIRSSLAKTIW
jgi:hypothetical protein